MGELTGLLLHPFSRKVLSDGQRFADLRWAGLLPLMFMRSTKLSATAKLSAEHETPPIANVLLPAGFLFRLRFVKYFSFN